MTDSEFELYEQRLKDQKNRINKVEFKKHLMLVPNQNTNLSKENKVYMPTDAAFREQLALYEESVTDLYKKAVNNFKTHWPTIYELNLEFLQLDVKKKKMELLRKQLNEFKKSNKKSWKKIRNSKKVSQKSIRISKARDRLKSF